MSKQQPTTGPISLQSGGGREIPTLHGLRAVSIGLVIVSHIAMSPQPGAFALFHRYGELGVLVFFVISGYLITTLLSTELDQRGGVSLRRFYLRRTLRIVPAYVTYLIGAAIIGTLVPAFQAHGRWWPALTYTSNFFLTGNWLTAHSWSLSVEEQFYLSWPFAFVIAGRRRALWIAVGALVATPVLRVLMYLASHDSYLPTIVNHDFIAAGCALALLAPRLQGRLWQSILRWGWVALILAMVLYHFAFGDGRWTFALRITVGEGLIALLLAIGVIWCIANANSVLGRFLDSSPIRSIGILSYSLYLWQQPFFGPTPLVSAEWAPLFITVAAALSYFVVERPALSLKRRFERYLVLNVPTPESDQTVRPITARAVVET